MVENLALTAVARPLKTLIGLAAITLGCLSATAWAAPDWLWLDGAGRKVYSDTPPPPTIPDKNILQRPGRTAYLPPADTPPPASAAPAKPVQPAAKAATEDPSKVRAKRDADTADAAKRQADEERDAATRADTCTRTRNNLATLNTGMRLATVNARGEQEVMDDTTRAAEAQRLQQVMQENCR